MPLIRRVPKRGFIHKRPIPIEVVNLQALNRFPTGSEVNPSVLGKAGLVRLTGVWVKILGEVALAHPLTIKAHRFSKSALAKIGQAGGTAEVLPC